MTNISIPTIFLDANALHNVASYLIQANQRQLAPFGGASDLNAVRQALRAALPKGIADSLTNGFRTLAYLQYVKEQEQAEIYTSRLAIAELWYGRLDGQAHIRMALEGIPYRQRQRQTDISSLVMSRLTQSDYQQVERELDGFLDDSSTQFGLNISLIEENSNARDVAQLSLEIQKRTFLDVIDCTLFASSLAVLSTSFITADNHLYTVIGTGSVVRDCRRCGTGVAQIARNDCNCGENIPANSSFPRKSGVESRE